MSEAFLSATERARRVKLLVCDVDGVLTNGQLIYLPDGREAKAFHTLDGLGIQTLQKANIPVQWLTARSSEVVARRALELGVTINQGAREKGEAIEAIAKKSNVSLEQVAYIGDDWLDLPAMRRVGFACTVPNAATAVRERAHWCAKARGGEGAVRELAELILNAQGKLAAAVGEYV
jgi:3-deoxy-D-manno-octulosonate 8-phosphate phosphatase (KDO 8-P phosphatase)